MQPILTEITNISRQITLQNQQLANILAYFSNAMASNSGELNNPGLKSKREDHHSENINAKNNRQSYTEIIIHKQANKRCKQKHFIEGLAGGSLTCNYNNIGINTTHMAYAKDNNIHFAHHGIKYPVSDRKNSSKHQSNSLLIRPQQLISSEGQYNKIQTQRLNKHKYKHKHNLSLSTIPRCIKGGPIVTPITPNCRSEYRQPLAAGNVKKQAHNHNDRIAAVVNIIISDSPTDRKSNRKCQSNSTIRICRSKESRKRKDQVMNETMSKVEENIQKKRSTNTQKSSSGHRKNSKPNNGNNISINTKHSNSNLEATKTKGKRYLKL